MSAKLRRAHSLHRIRAGLRQLAGRDHQVRWEDLDDDSLAEVERLVGDLERERAAAVRRAQMTPFGRR